MPACEACLPGNILKNNRAGLHKAAGSYWAVLAIEIRLLRAGTGHSGWGHSVLRRLLSVLLL
jgi:hypothetical protein